MLTWLPCECLLTVTANAQHANTELTARSCTPELRIPGSLENSRSCLNHLKSFCIRRCKFWKSLNSVA